MAEQGSRVQKESNKRFGKRDIILLVILFIVFLAIFIGYRMTRHADSDAQVVITVDGDVYGTYDLYEDQTIPILIDGTETNRLQIEDGKADMISADCPDLICVNEQPIRANGETIVCLPNKVVVTIKSSEESDLDTIAQ